MTMGDQNDHLVLFYKLSLKFKSVFNFWVFVSASFLNSKLKTIIIFYNIPIHTKRDVNTLYSLK